MTAPDDKPQRPHLGDDEHALWRVVPRSIAPLKRKKPTAPADPAGVAVPARARGTVVPVRIAVPPARTAPKKSAPPLVPIDRPLKRAIARGGAVDGRIDLHGQTQ